MSLLITILLISCFLCSVFLITDVFRPVLRSNQPLQEPTYLFWEHHWDVQRKEEAWDASTHLCHLWVSIPLHASRYDSYHFSLIDILFYYFLCFPLLWGSKKKLCQVHENEVIIIIVCCHFVSHFNFYILKYASVCDAHYVLQMFISHNAILFILIENCPLYLIMERINSVCDHVSKDLKILNCFEKIRYISTIIGTMHSNTSGVYSTYRFKQFLITFFRITGHSETFVMPKLETHYLKKNNMNWKK